MHDEAVMEWTRTPWKGGQAFGSPGAHLDFEVLIEGFEALAAPPIAAGTVHTVVCRQPGEQRTVPARVQLCPDQGIVGDRWILGSARPEMQVAIMRADVAHLIANGQHGALFGDNLLVDLDLSEDHMPPGTRLQVGTALCEVSTQPHNGCSQFQRRFGSAALKLTADKRWRSQHLRGIYLTVLETGEVGPGDALEVHR